MLRLAPDLPDALVGVAGVKDGRFDQGGQALPRLVGDLGRTQVEVGVDRIEEHAPHVVLMLVPRPVADPYRPGVAVAGEVVERVLGQVLLAADAVHDLQAPVGRRAAGHRLEHEGEVLEGLPVEAQAVQRAQHERGVPDPGVAVVPVAGPARRLGQRRGGRRHDGPGRGVAQTLQGQRAALDVAAPGMVGKCAGGQPVPPVGDGVVELGLGVLHRGRLAGAPGEGDEGGLAPVETGPPVAAGSGHSQADARSHGQRGVAGRRVHGHGPVALAVVVPDPLGDPYSKIGATLTTTSTRPPMQWARRSRVPVAAESPGARR